MTGGIAIVVIGAWLTWPILRPERTAPAVSTAASLQPMAPARAPVPVSKATITLSAEDTAFIKDLREKFATRIEAKHTQIRLIEQLISYLMQRYPDDWQTRVQAFLQELFPALADSLYEKFTQLMRYNDWLRSNRELLMAMPGADRRAALWAARHEAFGADAEEIFVAQRQSEQVRDALVRLDAMPDAPVDQKLDVFLKAVNEAYGPDAEQLLANRGTELMNGFLAVDAVQDDLRALSPTQRQAALRDIRASMGLDAAALERWDALDAERDATWSSGERYMAERERVQREHDGVEEDRQLRRLQDEQFGAEADTIRQEESAGFYRYGRARRIGRE